MISLNDLRSMERCGEGRERRWVDALIEFCEENFAPDAEMVECGTWDGVSTAVFSHFVKSITTIDHDWRPAPVLEGCHNAKRIRADSVDAAKLFADASLDVVYLDTAHTCAQVKAEVAAWRPKLKPGGIMAGHDYRLPTLGVIEAVTELFDTPDRAYRDSTWMVRLGGAR